MNPVSFLSLPSPSAIMKLQLLWRFAGAIILSPIVTGWWSLSQSLSHVDAESPEGEFRFYCFSCCQHSPFQFVDISPLIKKTMALWHMPWYCTQLCKSLASPLHRMHSLEWWSISGLGLWGNFCFSVWWMWKCIEQYQEQKQKGWVSVPWIQSQFIYSDYAEINKQTFLGHSFSTQYAAG